MDPLSIADNIYTLASLIYVQAKKVKANQERCQLLAQRVAAVESAIKNLSKLPDKEAFCQSLQRLEACFTQIQDYMNKLAGAHWFRQFLQTHSHESTFKKFNDDLTLAISELSLDLDAQALINPEADQKAAQADRTVLLAKQDEIFNLNQAMLTKINKIPDKSFHQRQQESMRLRLDQLFQMMLEIKSPLALSSPKSPAIALDAKIIIPYFELALEAKIARGTFGMIYQGRWHEQVVAIKVWEGQMSEHERAQFIRETQILQHLNVPSYVPQFYGVCLENNQACLVLEYCPLGSLDTRLTGKQLPPVQQRAIALSLAKSLAFLHQRQMIHRYLKSANVLLKKEAGSDLLQARITGFGLSKTQYPSIVSAQLNLEEIKTGLAPEVLTGEEATPAADVYSFGIILKEILTSYRSRGEAEDGLAEIDERYADLVHRCCNPSPQQRPDMKAVIGTITALPPPAPPLTSALTKLTPATLAASAEIKTSPSASPLEWSALPEVNPRPSGPPSPLEGKAEAKKPGKEAAMPVSPVSPSAPIEVTAYERAKQYHKQKDFVQARKYYEMALAARETKAQVKLAALLIRGDGGVPETRSADQEKAFILFQEAAARGDVLAIQNLIKIYKHGVGSIPADPIVAAQWGHRLLTLQPASAQSSAVQSATTTPQAGYGQLSQAISLTVLGGGARQSPAALPASFTSPKSSPQS